MDPLRIQLLPQEMNFFIRRRCSLLQLAGCLNLPSNFLLYLGQLHAGVQAGDQHFFALLIEDEDAFVCHDQLGAHSW